MNKAILSRLLELPLSEDDCKTVYTLGMDWVGPRGYMFAVKKINDIYIAKHTNNLSIPEYLHQLPSFIATLKNLYIWKNHHTKLQNTILTGVIASIASGTDDTSRELSPNTGIPAPSSLEKLVGSMTSRCDAVIEAKGGNTRY